MRADVNPLPPIALLAGGMASRLRPLTETIPKSLIPVAGEPFIAHQLNLIRSQGGTKVIVCAGYLWEQIRDFVGDGARFDLSVEYSLDGDICLGTGGALKKALPKLGPEFLSMYGDSYLPTSFRLAVDFFRDTRSLALMTIHHNEGHWDKSNVVFQKGKITAYDKHHGQPEMAYIDYGLGCFRAAAFAGYPDGTALDLADVYSDLLSRGQLAGYEVKERFYEIGSHEGINETDLYLKERIS